MPTITRRQLVGDVYDVADCRTGCRARAGNRCGRTKPGCASAVAELVRTRRASAAAGDDLLARMLRASDPETGRSMSDELLVDNIVAFLMAGYDTTAFALTWTLYLISQSPEWEARMLEEIEQVVGIRPGDGRPRRAARGGPAGPERVAAAVSDRADHRPRHRRGHRVRRRLDSAPARSGSSRSTPFIATAALGRSGSVRSGSLRARAGAKPSRFQFMPFGAGPRICIGAAFAMIEATIMLATFVRAARFEVGAGFRPATVGTDVPAPEERHAHAGHLARARG